MTKHAPQYTLEIVLPTLLQKTNSIDANVRHGSIISIGEIIYALSLIDELCIGMFCFNHYLFKYNLT